MKYLICDERRIPDRRRKMVTKAEKRLIQEERMKRIKGDRDRLKSLGCPVADLDTWIEEQEQLLRK